MRAKDFITEDEPVVAGDYQKMLAFVNANKLVGIPPEQQVGVALFKELQRLQQRNNNLETELDAAEKRIDIGAKRADMYGKQLSNHQAELDKERAAIDQQQSMAGELDQQYAERAQASQQQVNALAASLEDIKTKPGIDKSAAAALEKQIQDLATKGISAEKYAELEQNIAAVQQMNQVDNDTMKDLIAQVNDAKSKAAELDKTKHEIGSEMEKSTKASQDQIDQLKQQIDQFKGIQRTVASLQTELTDLETEYDETSATLFDLENDVHRIDTMIAARNQATNAAQMIRTDPQAAAQTQQTPATAPQPAAQPAATPQTAPATAPATPGWRIDPRAAAQKLVDKGVLQSVDETQFFEAIKWATRK